MGQYKTALTNSSFRFLRCEEELGIVMKTFMKSHSDLFLIQRRARTLSLCALLFALSLAASADHPAQAQDCPVASMSGHSSGGCGSASTDPDSTLSKQQNHEALSFPGADHASEASANGSLSSGANYTERSSTTPVRGMNKQFDPEPLSEFQRFVAATTGQLLPVYGARLFTSQPERFGPLDHGAASAEMIIASDDELRIRLWGQVNFSADLRVSREGEIYLPKVGAVHVAGLPFAAVTAHLRSALNRVYRNYEFSVDLGEIHSIQVYVTGQVRKPGEYTVSGLSTLADALFSTGGPSTSGSMRHIQLKRQGEIVADFDLYRLLIDGDKTGDLQLQSGDVVFIPPVGAQVALLGSVQQVGIYELRGEQMLSQLIDAAGGKTALAQGARLSFERIEEHAERRAFEVSADAAGLATFLKNGDIVRVDPIASNYRETVTLRGSVASPGRFSWHAGMRLSELLPDRDSLVARDYWWHRTQLGLPAPEFMPAIDGLTVQLGSDRTPLTVPRDHLYERSLTESVLQTTAQSEARDAEATTENSARSGQSGSVASTHPQAQLEHQVAVLRPRQQTNWNYAVIERVDPKTMRTALIPFDLGRLVLAHDPAYNLELEPGDVVTIFSQDDIELPLEQQTKYVRLEGEFAHPGIYSTHAGETLRALASRAGGLTANAYLYGSEFTRKSTRALEQRRLNEVADRLEQQMQQGPPVTTSGAGSSQEGANEATAMRREMIARLHQLRATGRIVLDLPPESIGVDRLPDLPLEDGDRLVLPSLPATVQVNGAVMNQNAFLFRRDATVSSYVSLAGGLSRTADKRRPFILRADGSVTPRNQGHVFRSTNFEKLHLNPGDTIVVPERVWHPSNLSEVMAWVQLFSSLSLSAAAINVIK